MSASTPSKRSLALIRAQERYEATQRAKERRERYEATDKAKALKAGREKRRPSRAEYRKAQRAKKKLDDVNQLLTNPLGIISKMIDNTGIPE